MPRTAYAFHGSHIPTFEVAAGDIVVTPRGRAARLERAAAEALPTGLAALRRWRSQADPGEPDPLIVVCAVDAELGRRLVEARLGPDVPATLCGVVAFLLPLADRRVAESGEISWATPSAELARYFGRQAGAVLAEIAQLQPGPSESIWAFAVNRLGLDVRVMRAPELAGAGQAPAQAPPSSPATEEPPQ